jgi:hypothetical protein
MTDPSLVKFIYRIASGILLLLPAILLACFGVVGLRNGTAEDAAVPVPIYMVAQVPMARAAYADATAALAHADRRNGEAIITRAEAEWHVSAPPTEVASLLTAGLMEEPASARGWTLLSEVLVVTDKLKAADALTQALVLAPREYWLIEARARDAAILWPELGNDSQAMALEQARMLWKEPVLRNQLRLILQTPEGVSIINQAFADQPDEIRAMNRWLRRERERETTSP